MSAASKLTRIWRVEGPRGVVGRVVGKARDVATRVWRRVAQYRNIVFSRGRDGRRVTPTADMRIERWDDWSAFPQAQRDALAATFGARAVAVDESEVRRGAVLWLGWIGAEICGATMSRRGRFFRKWFVPLEPADIVIFRNRTAERFRGRGVCPTLMQHVIATELEAESGRAFVDCRVYNHASIRSIEKIGFERIAVCRPLRRGEALGEA